MVLEKRKGEQLDHSSTRLPGWVSVLQPTLVVSGFWYWIELYVLIVACLNFINFFTQLSLVDSHPSFRWCVHSNPVDYGIGNVVSVLVSFL